MGLYVEVEYITIDPESGERFSGGEDPLTETVHDTPGALFRSLSGRDRSRSWEALGRCTGRVYIDRKDGTAQHVGWAFVKRVTNAEADPRSYYGTDEGGRVAYLREAWVTVHEKPPTVTRTVHLAELGGAR